MPSRLRTSVESRRSGCVSQRRRSPGEVGGRHCVPEGVRIVEAASVIDAPQVPILTAAGVTTVVVRRRVRVAVISNGNERFHAFAAAFAP